MLYREIMAFCSEIHTKHINTLCGQNVELLNVKLAVHIVTAGLQSNKECTHRQFREHVFHPLSSELNAICHLLALLAAHHILHFSRIRVKRTAQLVKSLSQNGESVYVSVRFVKLLIRR